MKEILFLLLFISCGSLHRESQKVFSSILARGSYAEALDFLDKSELKEDSNSKVLYYLQRGAVLFELGKYKESTAILHEAQRLLDQHIKSISTNIATYLAGDGIKNYLGEYLEQGMIHFYLTLNYLLQGQEATTAKRKSQLLYSARAQIVAWDIFFEKIKQDDSTMAKFYPTDFLVKIFGALVHEKINKRSESLIAYDLYKNAYDALDSFGRILPSFNHQSKNCALREIDSTKKCLVSETQYLKDLKKFLEGKIINLASQFRRKDLKKWETKFGIKYQKSKKNNISIIVKSALIPRKKPYRFYAPIITYYPNYRRHRRHNYIFGDFATNILGLHRSPRHINAGEYVFANYALANATRSASISFEMPSVEKNAPRTLDRIEFVGSDEKKIKAKAVLVSPLGDLLHLNNDLRVKELYPKLASRFVFKHAAAIVTAQSVYKGMKGGERESMKSFWARTSALLAYSGAVNIFEKLQRADTRYWSALPQDVFLAEASINKNKKYDIYAIFKDGSSRLIKKLDESASNNNFFSITISQ